jgi:hypothetical protein
VADPYKLLFTDEQRKIVTLDKAINLLFSAAVSLENLYEHARTQAILAHRMTVLGQLLGTHPEEHIGYDDENERPTEEKNTAARGPRAEGTSSGGEPSLLSAAIQSD